MGNFSYTRHYIDDDNQTRSMTNTAATKKDGFFNALNSYNDIVSIRVEDASLDDADAKIIAQVVANNPKLWKLELLTNFIGPEGVDAIADAATKHGSLRHVNLARNCLKNREGGEAVTRLIAACPRLENLNVSSNMLGDDGAEAVAAGIADAPQMRQFFAANINTTQTGFATLVNTVAQHHNLCSANLMRGENVSVKDPQEAHIVRGLLEGKCPNLTLFSPHTDDSDALCADNKEKTSAAAHLLLDDLGTLTYSQFCAIAERWPAITRDPTNIKPPLITSEKSLGHMLQKFPDFLKTLPELPESGNINALFTPDAKGYAPLDNPRLWQNPKAVMDYVANAGQSLDTEFLARETDRGVGFMQSALGVAPLSLVLPLLNEAGVRLQDEVLLDAKKQPSPLFRQLLNRGVASELFTTENWKGGSSAAMRTCAAHLPEAQQAQLPMHTLAATLQVNAAGAAHGR